MNTYKKYCPNVFVAKCTEQHENNTTIVLTTKYGKEHENIVHNFLGKTSDDFYLYSITRADGFDAQERAKNKVEKLEGYAANADKRSDEYYEKSNKHRDFLSLGEPIKIGHHSEKRHRKLIESNWNNMGKSVAESDKAKAYRDRQAYWEDKANTINLSMPESLEFYEFKLHEAKELHKMYKDNPEKREHSYSLTYANKAVKENKKNLDLAVRLWGTAEEIELINNEKIEQAKKKIAKTKKKEDIIEKLGGFFAFNNNQFKEGYQKIKDSGHVTDDEKLKHVMSGLYIPSKNVDEFLNAF